jgi:hypothetical protein
MRSRHEVLKLMLIAALVSGYPCYRLAKWVGSLPDLRRFLPTFQSGGEVVRGDPRGFRSTFPKLPKGYRPLSPSEMAPKVEVTPELERLVKEHRKLEPGPFTQP